MCPAACALHAPVVLCLLALAIAAAGSLLPVSPSEPMLVALAAAAPDRLLLPLALLMAAGCMAAKLVVYRGGRTVPRALPARHRALVERARARLAGRPWLQRAALVLSGALGLPPFYLVTVICGALRIPLRDFLLAGGAGRVLRFGTLVLLPRLLGVRF